MSTAERPRMPAIECTPWCTNGDGHPNEAFREDQTCWSTEEYVELSLQPPPKDPDWPEKVGVMARRNHESTVVYVHLQDICIDPDEHRVASPYNILDHALLLTPVEAERLARALLATAAVVRADEVDRWTKR